MASLSVSLFTAILLFARAKAVAIYGQCSVHALFATIHESDYYVASNAVVCDIPVTIRRWNKLFRLNSLRLRAYLRGT